MEPALGGGENIEIFDQLYSQKQAIENAFGDSLEWQRLDTKRARRIKKALPGGGLADHPGSPRIQSVLIDMMIRFEKALKP